MEIEVGVAVVVVHQLGKLLRPLVVETIQATR